MKRKILIYGGSGSIGFSIAKKLKEDDYDPIIISRNEEKLNNLSKKISCNYEVCDVFDYNQIENIAKKYQDEVFGLAYCVGSINLRPLKLTKDEDFIESFKIFYRCR